MDPSTGHWVDVLATWWPRLLPGMVAGSTHGVIRVGHAVRTLRADPAAEALDELANGLAFWAARYRPLPLSGRAVALDACTALRGMPRLAHQSGFIAHRLARLGPLPPPLTASDALTGLHELIEAATRAYLSFGYGSPVLLVHTATAPNAVAQVLPVLPEDLWQASYDTSWASAAALMAMYGPSSSQRPPETEPGTVDAVLDFAAAHGDEHVLKFADTVVDAYGRRPDPELLRAARQAGSWIGVPE